MSTYIYSIARDMELHYLAGIFLAITAASMIILFRRSAMAYKHSTQPDMLVDQALPHSRSENRSRWSIDGIAFLLTCIAATVPVWIASFPPMADLPQHAAQISLFYALQDPSFAFANLFSVNLFTPYLFGYGVMAALVPLFGIVVACKITISIAIAATPLATRFLLREAGAEPYLAWLSFPALYGFAYQWGFVNFVIAAPLGLLALAVVWRRERIPSLATSLFTALLFNFLFFCHALALALFGVIATAFWAYRERTVKAFAAHAWPLATVVPFAIFWLVSKNSHPAVRVPIEWDLGWFESINAYYAFAAMWTDADSSGWGRINGLFPRLFGIRSHSLSLAIGTAIAILPFLVARFRFALPAAIPLAVCALVLLFVPSVVFGTALIFQRFTQYLLPFYLFLFLPLPNSAPSTVRRMARTALPVIALLWIGMMTQRALEFDDMAGDFEQVIERLPEEKRALSMVFLRDDDTSIAPTFLHFPAWYSALKNGVVDKSFAVTQIQPVVYRPETTPRSGTIAYEWLPQLFSWSFLEADQYDYFIVRADMDVSRQVFSSVRCPPRLTDQVGLWWVYRRSTPDCS